jgi:hypothetical protein
LFISVLKWISLATAVGIISFLITGHRSVYPSQVLASEKSSSLEVQKGEEIGEIEEVRLNPRRKSVTGNIKKILEEIQDKIEERKDSCGTLYWGRRSQVKPFWAFLTALMIWSSLTVSRAVT